MALAAARALSSSGISIVTLARGLGGVGVEMAAACSASAACSTVHASMSMPVGAAVMGSCEMAMVRVRQ
jgi:molybdenum cofactor biosynthesis enzyme